MKLIQFKVKKGEKNEKKGKGQDSLPSDPIWKLYCSKQGVETNVQYYRHVSYEKRTEFYLTQHPGVNGSDKKQPPVPLPLNHGN